MVSNQNQCKSDLGGKFLKKVLSDTLYLFAILFLQAVMKISLTTSEYEEILNSIPKDIAIEHYDTIACDWLKANEDHWRFWVPSVDTEKTKIYIGGIFPMGGKVYTARGIMAG